MTDDRAAVEAIADHLMGRYGDTFTTRPAALGCAGSMIALANRIRRPRRVVIDVATPKGWIMRHVFRVGRGRAAGIVIALSPTVFAIGAEAIIGSSRGIAIILGPVWFGFIITRLTKQKDLARFQIRLSRSTDHAA